MRKDVRFLSLDSMRLPMLKVFAVLLLILSSPLFATTDKSCESQLASTAATYIRLLNEGLSPKGGGTPVLNVELLQKISISQINPLASVRVTAENSALKAGLAKVATNLTLEEQKQVLDYVRTKIRAHGLEIQMTDSSAEITAKLLSPELINAFTFSSRWDSAEDLKLHQNFDGKVWLAIPRGRHQANFHTVDIFSSKDFSFQSFERKEILLGENSLRKLHSSRDQRLWAGHLSNGKLVKATNLSEGTELNYEVKDWTVESLDWVEDKTGRKFLIVLQSQPMSDAAIEQKNYRYEILEVGAELKSQVTLAVDNPYSDLRVLESGEAILTSYDQERRLFIWNISNGERAVQLTLAPQMSGELRMGRAYPFKTKKGQWVAAVVAGGSQVEESAIQFLEEGSPPIELHGYFAVGRSYRSWHETADGRLIFGFNGAMRRRSYIFQGERLVFVEPFKQESQRIVDTPLKTRLLNKFKSLEIPRRRYFSYSFEQIYFEETPGEDSGWIQHPSGDWSLIAVGDLSVESFKLTDSKFQSEFAIKAQTSGSVDGAPLQKLRNPNSSEWFTVRRSRNFGDLADKKLIFTNLSPSFKGNRVYELNIEDSTRYSEIVYSANGDAHIATMIDLDGASRVQIVRILGRPR